MGVCVLVGVFVAVILHPPTLHGSAPELVSKAEFDAHSHTKMSSRYKVNCVKFERVAELVPASVILL